MSKISELSNGGALLSTDDLIVVRSGGNVRAQLSSLNGIAIGGSTPAAGSFTTGSFSGNVSFADNAKAIFGAGSDLQIYHDGSNSYISDQGTNDLKVLATDFQLKNAADTEFMMTAVTDGAVTFYHNNAAKLATTSSGIDVTGSVTANAGRFDNQASTPVRLHINNSGTNDYASIYADTASAYKNLVINPNGGNVGIGESVPLGKLHVKTGDSGATPDVSADELVVEGSGNAGINILTGNSSNANIYFGATGGSPNRVNWDGYIAYSQGQRRMTLGVAAGGNSVSIDSTGVGIGTSSPARALSTKSSSVTVANFESTSATGGLISFSDSNTTNDVTVRAGAVGDNLVLQAGGTERMSLTSTGALEFKGASTTTNAQAFITNDNSTLAIGSSVSGSVVKDIHFNSPSTMMVIDGSSGSVGIGTSSPSAKLDVGGNIIMNGATGTSPIFEMINNDNEDTDTGRETSIRFSGHRSGGEDVINAQLSAHHDGSADDDKGMLFFYTNNGGGLNLAMKIRHSALVDITGALSVAGTAKFASWSNSGASNGIEIRSTDGQILNSHTGTGLHVYQYFYNANGVVGSISASGSSTAFNTSSDYRLKENVAPMTGATERLKQLAPKRFNFIADADTTVDGFLAHEVADVVPEAITGTKDAMRDEEYEVTPAVLDDDGNVVEEAVMGTRLVPDYQGIDQSKLVPLLVATIQELEARITQLENN